MFSSNSKKTWLESNIRKILKTPLWMKRIRIREMGRREKNQNNWENVFTAICSYAMGNALNIQLGNFPTALDIVYCERC